MPSFRDREYLDSLKPQMTLFQFLTALVIASPILAALRFTIAAAVIVFAYNYAVRSFVPALPYLPMLTGFIGAAGIRAARILLLK